MSMKMEIFSPYQDALNSIYKQNLEKHTKFVFAN